MICLKDKINILKEVDKNNVQNRVELVKNFNILMPTLNTIVYNKNKTKETASACEACLHLKNYVCSLGNF